MGKATHLRKRRPRQVTALDSALFVSSHQNDGQPSSSSSSPSPHQSPLRTYGVHDNHDSSPVPPATPLHTPREGCQFRRLTLPATRCQPCCYHPPLRRCSPSLTAKRGDRRQHLHPPPSPLLEIARGRQNIPSSRCPSTQLGLSQATAHNKITQHLRRMVESCVIADCLLQTLSQAAIIH